MSTVCLKFILLLFARIFYKKEENAFYHAMRNDYVNMLWNKCIGILLDKIQVEFIINPILL